jgi:ATP-dependent Clp protease adaptor protein ClpS
MHTRWNTQWQEDVEELVLVDDSTEEWHDLVVYNDDVNTFEHVINTLIRVCNHSNEQAEQCTYIIHFKGKCSVKKGSFEELVPMRQGIVNAGINAEIH